MINFDKVTLGDERRAALIDELAAYAETDMLCYFAEEEALQKQQRAAWEPVLNWAEGEMGVSIARTQGIMPVAQPPELKAHCADWLASYDDPALVAVAQLVTQLGSVLLAMALAKGAVTLEQATQAAQLDEAFQQAQWGEDDAKQEELTEKSDKIRQAYGYL